MLTNQERKILHMVCRESLLKLAVNSNVIKENTTFKEQVNVCNSIKNLSYEESISFVFNKGEMLDEFGVRDFESKFKKVIKYGLAGIAGGVMASGLSILMPVGITVGLVTMFLFRKATDPCYQVCLKKFGRPTQRKFCKYDCQTTAIKNIVSDIRSQIGRCARTTKPKRCEKSLNKQYIKWSKKLQKQIVLMNQFKQNTKEKELQKANKEVR